MTLSPASCNMLTISRSLARRSSGGLVRLGRSRFLVTVVVASSLRWCLRSLRLSFLCDFTGLRLSCLQVLHSSMAFSLEQSSMAGLHMMSNSDEKFCCVLDGFSCWSIIMARGQGVGRIYPMAVFQATIAASFAVLHASRCSCLFTSLHVLNTGKPRLAEMTLQKRTGFLTV